MAEDSEEYQKMQDSSLELLNSEERRLSTVKEITNELKEQGELGASSSQSWNSVFKDLSKMAETAVTNWDKVNKGAKDLDSIQKDITKSQDLGAQLQTKQAALLKQGGLSAKDIQKVKDGTLKVDDKMLKALSGLNDKQKELVMQARDGLTANKENLAILAQQETQVKKSYTPAVKGMKALGGMMSKLGLDSIGKSFESAGESMRKAKAEGKGFGGQMKALLGDILNINIAALALKAIMLALEFDTRITELGIAMGVSADEAVRYQQTFLKAKLDARDSAINTKKMQENLMEINNHANYFKKVSGENLATSVELSTYYGLQGKQLAEVNNNAILQGKSQKDVKMEVLGAVSAGRQQTGLMIDARKIMQGVNSVTSDMKANFHGNTEAIAEALVVMEQLGTTLESTSKSAGALLNFEQSISAELEAELLTGKQLNLEKARMFALDDDMVGLAKELSAQAGGLQGFTDMNRLQKEAMAKAIGKSVSEMATMLEQEEIANKSAEELRDMGREDLATKLEQQTAQQELNNMIAEMQDIFVNIIGPYLIELIGWMKDGMGTAVTDITTNLQMWMKELDKMGAFDVKKWKELGKQFKTYVKDIKKLLKLFAKMYIWFKAFKAIQIVIGAIRAANLLIAKSAGKVEQSNQRKEKAGLGVKIASAVAKAWAFLGPILGAIAGVVIVGLALALSSMVGDAKFKVGDGAFGEGDGKGAVVPSPIGGTRLDSDDHLIKTKDGFIAGTDLFGGAGNNAEPEIVEASQGPAEVVLDTFNLSTYSNMQRFNDKTDTGYII
jgi:hypothetical protein